MGEPTITTRSTASPHSGLGAPPPDPSPPAPGAPLRVDSPHCLDASIADLKTFGDTLAGNPCPPVMTELLPQILDRGNTEIQFEAPLNVGEYRGGVAVTRPTWMHARIWMENGRLRGTIDFFPPITKRGGILGVGDASLSQLQITTDDAGNVRFSATATFLNLPIPLIGSSTPMNVTEELTETLFGRRMSSIPGPMSRVLQTFMEAQASSTSRLENLVRMDAARFRIVANPREGDAPVPGLGDVSNAAFRIDELRVSPTVTMRDVHLRMEIWPNEETGGFRVVIPEASIGEIRHAPTTLCNGEPNPGSTIRNVRLEDVTLNLDPRGERTALGNDMFTALGQSLSTVAAFCSGQPANFAALADTQPLYPASGSGRILFGGADIQNDIIVNPAEGDQAVTFNIAGERNGDLTATIDAPELGIDRAALALGGEMLLGHAASVGLDDAIVRSLHATVNLRSGEVSYNARFTPVLASATLEGRNPEGNLLAGVSLMGFTSGPVTVEGTAVGTDRESHRVRVEGGRLEPSRAEFHNPLPAAGEANFGFGGLGLDATFTRTGMRLNRLVLPEYHLSADVRAGGNRIRTSIANGRETPRMLAGLGLVLDDTDSAGHAADVTHTATINTRVERLRFSTPRGTFEMTGTLTGTMGLLDKHTTTPGTFTPPDFRPTAGGMRLTLHGTVRQIGGAGMRLSGRISIRDTESGRLTISGGSTIPTDEGDVTARTSIVANMRDLLRTHRFPRAGTPDGSAVNYYDFDPDADSAIPLPQILVEAAVPGVGTLRTIGSGRISGLPRNPNFRADLPFGEQHLTIDRSDVPFTGTVDLNGGGLNVRGDTSRITVDVRPPETVDVNLTQEVDGVTYTYAGSLTSRSSFRATINPATGGVAFRERGDAPQLEGDLTVTATTLRDGRTVTLGSGTAHVSTTYALTGRASGSSAHLELSVPETGLSGEVTSAISIGGNTIPAGTSLNIPIRNFSGTIDLNTRSLGFTSRWTAGDIGPARVTIPHVSLPGGIEFDDVTAEFSTVANGQQWEVARGAGGEVSFRALPGTDGRLPPFEVNFSARDGDGSNLALTLTSSSRASGISGSNDPSTGEFTFDVTGMALESRLGGSMTVAGQRVDLSRGLTTDANLPRLQLHVNATTGAMRLVATPPTPTGITPPPTDLSDWMAWTTDQWRNYQMQINATDHMVVLSEEAISMPLADAFLPPGRGKVYIDMDPIDLSIPAGTADGPQRILTAIQNALHMTREFPNPPPRDGAGEPILLSDAQRPLYRTDGPPGTLFFIRERRADGEPRIDPDLAGNLENLLGVSSDEAARIIRSGRLEMSDLVDAVRRDPAVRDAISEDTLTALTESYLRTSGGSFRRFSNRMAIALGTIRESLPSLLTATGGFRPVHSHEFADPSYHATPTGLNDGSDMEFMAVLPVDPAAAARIIESTPSSTWDPWVTDSTISGSTETGTLLGDHRFTLTRSSTLEGNIRVLRMTPGSGGAMLADSRTFRLVPLSGGRTLLIMDQHEDYPEGDVGIRLPRMRLPERPPLDMENFGTSALTLINPRTPDMYAFYANRFALIAGGITNSANSADVRGLLYDSREPFSAVSRTSRIVEYLALDTTTDAANPSLTISPDAPNATVMSELTSRLGVSSTVAGRWVGARRIPLSELLTETGLASNFTVPVIQAAAEALLTPPPAARPTMRHFSSPTERLLIMVEDLRRISYLSTPSGNSYNTITRDFNHPRFHTTSTEQANDTVDTFMYWYVPASLGITPENITWFVHHADQFPRYDSNFATSSVVDRSTISGASPDRTYIDTGINVDMLGAFNYRISLPNDPLTLSGGVLFSPWAQEPRPGEGPGHRDFLINNGWWMTLPTSDGNGYVVIRAGVINTRTPADRDPTAASTAQSRVIGFMPYVLRAAADHAGSPPRGPIPSYNSTSAILYNRHHTTR